MFKSLESELLKSASVKSIFNPGMTFMKNC